MEVNKFDWIKTRLSDMISLKDGWVSGGRAIKERALKFTDTFFSCIDDYDNWDLGPYPNGSIIITFKHKNTHAGINVAETGISAFVSNDKKDLYETIELKFDETYVLDELLTFIKKYFYED